METKIIKENIALIEVVAGGLIRLAAIIISAFTFEVLHLVMFVFVMLGIPPDGKPENYDEVDLKGYKRAKKLGRIFRRINSMIAVYVVWSYPSESSIPHILAFLAAFFFIWTNTIWWLHGKDFNSEDIKDVLYSLAYKAEK